MTKDPFLAMKAKEASRIVRSVFVIYLYIATSTRYSAVIWNTFEIHNFFKMEPIEKSHAVR